MQAHFRKMNGAGNDFVVFDARTQPLSLSAEQLRHIADRANPVTKGCDQVVVMEQPSSAEADVFMRIFNADGTEVDACGNATRCIAWLLMRETGNDKAMVQTKAGMMRCTKNGVLITADMGEPRFAWDEIPLSGPCKDTLRLDLGVDGLPDAAAIGMGNPHVIFFTGNEVMLRRIETIGPEMQQHPLFSKHGVNVSIAYIPPSRLREGVRGRVSFSMPPPQPSPASEGGNILSRVWERGVGITQACGTAACASAVAAVKRGLSDRNVDIKVMQGGQPLSVRWVSANYGDPANNRVFLTGPAEEEFEGVVEV